MVTSMVYSQRNSPSSQLWSADEAWIAADFLCLREWFFVQQQVYLNTQYFSNDACDFMCRRTAV